MIFYFYLTEILLQFFYSDSVVHISGSLIEFQHLLMPTLTATDCCAVQLSAVSLDNLIRHPLCDSVILHQGTIAMWSIKKRNRSTIHFISIKSHTSQCASLRGMQMDNIRLHIFRNLLDFKKCLYILYRIVGTLQALRLNTINLLAKISLIIFGRLLANPVGNVHIIDGRTIFIFQFYKRIYKIQRYM